MLCAAAKLEWVTHAGTSFSTPDFKGLQTRIRDSLRICSHGLGFLECRHCPVGRSMRQQGVVIVRSGDRVAGRADNRQSVGLNEGQRSALKIGKDVERGAAHGV